MKTLDALVLVGALLASTAGTAKAQDGRHVPAQQVSQALPADVVGGSGSAVFSHRAQQGDVAVWVRLRNEGDCVMGVVKQRMRAGLRGRDRFLVQPGAEVYARYEKADFDVTVTCAESAQPGGACAGSVTMIPVRRGEPDASMGRLAGLEIYSGSPMPSGATCADGPVDLPLLHVSYGRPRLDAEVVNTGSAQTGCTTFEVMSNGSTFAADHAGAGGGAGVLLLNVAKDARLQARCTGGGGGCQGTLRLHLSP